MHQANRTPPIIDLTPLHQAPDGAAAAAKIDAIHGACVDTGFFIVIGHGLDGEIGAVFDSARAFFALPQANKERTPRIDRYGFVPHAGQALDKQRASTNTEYIDIGLADEIPLPEIQDFEFAIRSYQRRAISVAALILRALAVALGADPAFFADRMGQPQCRLRLLHYPEVEALPDGSLPVPTTPHTDYGAITMLATDGVPGLEVKPLDADWTPVSAPAGSLVINLGDMLARWTNDVYRSTPHRVVGPAAGDRMSIPFFVNPDPSTTVECIPACVTPARPCNYEPVTAGDFLASRIDSSSEPYIDPTEGPARLAAR